MTSRLLTVRIAREDDVVAARQRARQVAGALGFDGTDQTRVATAVSELARNAFQYAHGGTVAFELEGDRPPQVLTISVSDRGPGIANLSDVLSGRYRSSTGMGLGLVGTRRLMDGFAIESSEGGTTVTVRKLLPRRAHFVPPSEVGALVQQLAIRGFSRRCL